MFQSITGARFRQIFFLSQYIYLMQYETPKALRVGIDNYICYYNEKRGHDSLKGEIPANIYYSYDPAAKMSA